MTLSSTWMSVQKYKTMIKRLKKICETDWQQNVNEQDGKYFHCHKLDYFMKDCSDRSTAAVYIQSHQQEHDTRITAVHDWLSDDFNAFFNNNSEN